MSNRIDEASKWGADLSTPLKWSPKKHESSLRIRTSFQQKKYLSTAHLSALSNTKKLRRVRFWDSAIFRSAVLLALKGSIKRLKQLIKSGYFLPTQGQREILNGENGRTFLMQAAAAHTTVTKLLIQAKADVTAEDQEGCRAIHYATASNSIKRVDLLLEASADVNTSDKEGWTPLMLAAENGNLEMLKHLLVKNGDPTLLQSDGRNAASLAANSEKEGCVELLYAPLYLQAPCPTPQLPIVTKEKRRWKNVLILSPFRTNPENTLDELNQKYCFFKKCREKYEGRSVYVIKAKELNKNLKNPTEIDLIKLKEVDGDTKVYIIGHGSQGGHEISETSSGCRLSARRIAKFFSACASQLQDQTLHIRVLTCESASQKYASSDLFQTQRKKPSFCEALCTELFTRGIQAIVTGYVETVYWVSETQRTVVAEVNDLPRIGASHWIRQRSPFSKKMFFIDGNEKCKFSFVRYDKTENEQQKELVLLQEEFEEVHNFFLSRKRKSISLIENVLNNNDGKVKSATSDLIVETEWRFIEEPSFLARAVKLLDGYPLSTKELLFSQFSLRLFRLAKRDPGILHKAVQQIQHFSIARCAQNFLSFFTTEEINAFYKSNPFFISFLPDLLSNDALFLEAVKRNGLILAARKDGFQNEELLDFAVTSNKEVIEKFLIFLFF